LASLLAGCLAAWAEFAKEGEVRGEVITVGEDRVVIAKKEGGQMTLEAGWKQVEGKWGRDQQQIAFFKTLKPGDQVGAVWKLDEGTHFCVQRMVKFGPDGKPVADVGPGQPRREEPRKEEPRREGDAGGVNALREEIRSLRNEIAQLRELVMKLLEQQKPR
jgi:hypothetical protein